MVIKLNKPCALWFGDRLAPGAEEAHGEDVIVPAVHSGTVVAVCIVASALGQLV